MKRLTALVAATSLALSGCGGREQVQTTRSLEPTRTFELPPVRPADPAFRLDFKREVTRRVATKFERTRHLGIAVPVQIQKLKVASTKRAVSLRVAAVKPLAYRPMAPAPTREADFVWTSLLQGKAVVTPEAARKLHLAKDRELVIGGQAIPIGAFADAAVPNFADVLLPSFIAADLDLHGPRTLMIAVRRKTKVAELRARLRSLAPAARIRPLAARPAPSVTSPSAVAQGPLIGAMTYRIRKDGFIEPDPAWVSANIVSADVPILGGVMCHRLLVPQLASALAEIERKGLANEIDSDRYGGCYVPRFIGRDPRRGLSMHAFGLALDLNVSTNHYGTRGDMSPDVVAIFNKWGFAWGGAWSTPDPMHFELARLIQT